MLDQHFMIDKELLVRIIQTSKLNKDDVVLEIGPGTGNLTELIASKAKHLFVIEKDPELFKELNKKFSSPKITLIHDNASKAKFPNFDKCISNIPYTLCETLLWKFTRCEFKSLTLVVPKNFTDLILNKKPSRLQLLVDSYYNIELVEEISPESFEPQPKVLSALIQITPKETKSFIKEFLSQYDKKTKNALKEILMNKGLKKQQALEKISLNLRPKIQNTNIINLTLEEINIIKTKFEK